MKSVLTNPRILFLGLASWLVPFVVSIFFIDQSGQLAVDKIFFKSIMILVGGGVGVALLVRAFKHVTPTWQTGLAIGCIWLALNWILDIAVLIPLSGMTLADYTKEIGMRYLMIPMIATGMGAVALNSLQRD